MKSVSYSLVLFLFLLTSLAAGAQPDKYEAKWKEIDALILTKNLPRSALAEVQKLYAQAKKEGQDVQVVKALAYQVRLQQQLREEPEVAATKEIEAEIRSSREPATSLLYTLLADTWRRYYDINRWKLYQRTPVSGGGEDLRTWTTDDFHRNISRAYLQSLKNSSLLKATKVETAEPLLFKGNSRHLRPTLYDLLAHHALRYFENDERNVRRPGYAFELVQPQAFASPQEFARFAFVSTDSLSLQLRALQLYQELTRLHLDDARPDALLDLTLQRLQFANRYSTAPGKDSLYEQALSSLLRQYGTKGGSAQTAYLLASLYHERASRYQPFGDTMHRFDRLKAKNLLQEVLRDSSEKGEGWTNSFNLFQEITRPLLTFQVEKVNLPNQPLRALISYKDIGTLHLRLVAEDEGTRKLMETGEGNDIFWKTLLAAPSYRSWQQSLPVVADLQEHRTEIRVEGLPVGRYYLLASPDADFRRKQSVIGAQLFHVSTISYISGGNEVFVLHRETGQPLASATVRTYQQEYDYNAGRYRKTTPAVYTTGANGYVKLKEDKRQRNHMMEISLNKDRLSLEEWQYIYHYNEPGATRPEPARIFFFTDRSLYRPGQTVYFKGIAVAGKEREQSAAAGYKTKIYLRDANYQAVDSLELTTNDFGSLNGTFRLPQSGLNGVYSIVEKGNRNQLSFSVEEYKRPKFAVSFEPVKQTYRVNDSVVVEGLAKAYAGNNVDGAKVVYRVVRQPRFPYPWLWRGWQPQGEPMEIAHGEVLTDRDGKFLIRFKAIPDAKISPALEPVFTYRITTDITDINGETRSGEMSLSAGYKSLLLQTSIPDRVERSSLKNLPVSTRNMNGVHQSVPVTVSFVALVPPKRLIRPRYWQRPDQYVMSEGEYLRHFPKDEYSNESDPQSWSKGTVAWTRTDSSRMNGEWPLAGASIPAGFYEITITTRDKDGKEVKQVEYLEVYEGADGNAGRPLYLFTKGVESPQEPGATASVTIGTSAEPVYLISVVQRTGREKVFSSTPLGRKAQTFSYPVTEEDRGGFGVQYFFVKDNRVFQYSQTVPVPWSNKDLQVEYATFRDKTLPGSKEQWKVKIKGPKGDRAAAEVLASMYDASLDQFKPHAWQKPSIWPLFRGMTPWTGIQNFMAGTSTSEWVARPYRQFEKRYDQLRFSFSNRNDDYFDQYFGDFSAQSNGIKIRGAVTSAAAPQAEERSMAVAPPAPMVTGAPGAADAVTVVGYGGNREKRQDGSADTTFSPGQQPGTGNDPAIQVRKNLNETAFFFPALSTDAEGNVEFSFTAPEALTRWKVQAFAHTASLAMGMATTEIVTQKELMLQPNMPRFLRQGDALELNTKVVNLSGRELTGQVQLQLFDAANGQTVDGWFINSFPNQYFTVAAGGSEVVKFPVQVPFQFTSTLQWRLVARVEASAGVAALSDGEEAILPVLTNKALVVETLPMPMKGNGTKSFVFEKLGKAGGSETLQHQSLTVEYTSNPAWYAVMALPYLTDYPHECADQVWNRYYANALATRIAGSSPRIRQMAESWQKDSTAFLSNLQKNSELKTILLEETPWVLQAQSEAAQRKNIALLFDAVRMTNELKSSLQKLKSMQASNGGFVWFKGGPDDRYITQYIVTGIGHLQKLGVPVGELQPILRTAIPYLDKKIQESYEAMLKRKGDHKLLVPGNLETQYLYMRSFFPQTAVAKAAQPAYDHYRSQLKTQWMKQGIYAQGMAALALHRTGDAQTAAAILRSLKETSIVHEELGRYWKDVRYGLGWWWWQAPVETQSLLIEAFSEAGKNTEVTNELRTWLLRNKQTTHWRTTRATAVACYALLLQGTDWISSQPQVQVKLGATTIQPTGSEVQEGTGYFKKAIDVKAIRPEMSRVSLTVTNASAGAPGWGAVYWQYFEEMDKITSASTPLQLVKKLFVEKLTDRGPVLEAVTEGSELKVGDKIKVRIELRSDRDMEYLHLKDLRAAALEPVNVLSGYRWQGGLGYYETTRDLSTSFFIHYLPKGTYVFEYPLFVTHSGTFINGITTIQSMYAPEFSAHSEGVKIRVR